MPGEDLLVVEGLAHDFPVGRGVARRRGDRIRALRGVDLRLREGECLALVGESGSGKTTLARCLLRLLEPSEGRIVYRGRDVLSLTPAELRAFRREAQMVFQDPFGSLNPRMRVEQMLDEVLRVHGLERGPRERRRRVDELLRTVGLSPSHRSRYPHEFSGGQRQRLGIARALSVRPRFLVLDEPVSALDLSVQAQILNLLQDLREGLSLTYLFIAHDLGVVRQVADRACVLYLGEVVEEGPADSVLGDPRHPFTAALLAAESLEGGGGRPEGEPPVLEDHWEGCPFRLLCTHPEKDRQCEEENPALRGREGTHRVACWKAGRDSMGP